MLTQFFFENLRFAISLFAGLVFFAVGWLYFDAWQEKKETKEQIRYLGYFSLALSFLLAGTQVESTLIEIQLPSFLRLAIDFGSTAGRIGGYILIILSLILDPIQPRPDLSKLASLVFALPSFLKFPVLSLVSFFYPALASYTGLLYLKRTTVGYEAHLRAVVLSFFILGLSEFFSLFFLFRTSTNVGLYKLVAPFGIVWFIRYLSLGVAIFILGRWVFGYLLKRFTTQLFMIFTTSILTIFLVTAIAFSAILLGNIQREAFNRLEVDISVLSYAIDAKKNQTLSDAQLVAQNSQVVGAMDSRVKLVSVLENFLLSKEQSFLWVANSSGIVLARGEDKEKYGDSIGGDPLFKRVLAGETGATIDQKDGPFAPVITIKAGVPIKSGKKVIGVVIAGTIVDNAFVDGIKEATGLEASVYGENTLSATTLVSADGKNRPVGIKEENKRIREKVLEKGEALSLPVAILGAPYLGAYLPLKDVKDKAVGMIFVGKPQITVLQTAGRSIQLTFISTVVLLILSIIPSYFIARYIAKQVE